ncbi:MAG: hypothetical protein NW220_15670 [Leptolyngbyaceae cyanobacterium bins.349]|nr:hypothetical protein [Leptolyngbyaceae cyanobacterium bins.349]
MNQQQESRQAAAQAFFESLEQLQQSLEVVDNQPAISPTVGHTSTKATPPAEVSFDLNVWEDAIADIDQYIQDHNL